MTCSQCGSALERASEVCSVCGTRRQARPEEPAAPTAPGTRRWIIRAAIVLFVIVGVAVFADQLLRTYHPVIDDQPVVAMATVYGDEPVASVPVAATMEGEFITIPFNDVKQHKLVRFFDPEGQQQIPMIAYITPTGKLVTAMSSSEHCGSTDFYLRGNNIHCTNCASYWNMASLEAYACCARYYPDPFPSTVVGDKVRIEAATIRRWESRL